MGYLFGVVYKVISDETGYEPEEIHEIMKGKFGVQYTTDFAGEVHEGIKSLSLYTKEELSSYIEKIIKWAGEHFITIPPAVALPDELYINIIEK